MAKPFARQFYSSKAWQDCRNARMKKSHHLCDNCLAKGIYKPAKFVHHIEELTPINIHRPEITLSFDNLMCVCNECHNELHDNKGRWHKINEARRKEKFEANRYEVDENGRISAKAAPLVDENSQKL